MVTVFQIDDEVAVGFRKAVKKKHGRLYGKIKTEIRIALENHTKSMNGDKN